MKMLSVAICVFLLAIGLAVSASAAMSINFINGDYSATNLENTFDPPSGFDQLSLTGLTGNTTVSLPQTVLNYTTFRPIGTIPSNSSVVPIPGIAWLLGSGIMGLVGLRRKLNL